MKPNGACRNVTLCVMLMATATKFAFAGEKNDNPATQERFEELADQIAQLAKSDEFTEFKRLGEAIDGQDGSAFGTRISSRFSRYRLELFPDFRIWKQNANLGLSELRFTYELVVGENADFE